MRAFVSCTYAAPDTVLHDLSDRYVQAADELGLPHIPMFFMPKHGRISSDHFRTLAHVFEVIICDLPDAAAVKAAVHDVLAWYWATRNTRFAAATIAEVRQLGTRMRASLAYFDSHDMRARYRPDADILSGPLENVPKLHRAVRHVPEYIIRFGPYEDLTTEASEAANKPLKLMFRTCVPRCCDINVTSFGFGCVSVRMLCTSSLCACVHVPLRACVSNASVHRSNKRNASAIFAARLTRVSKMAMWELSRPKADAGPLDDEALSDGSGVFVAAADVRQLLPNASHLPGTKL